MFEHGVQSACFFFFFFKQKTAYEMRISDWSSDVCSSDLRRETALRARFRGAARQLHAQGDRQAAVGVQAHDSAFLPVRRLRDRCVAGNAEAVERACRWQIQDRKSTRLNSSH